MYHWTADFLNECHSMKSLQEKRKNDEENRKMRKNKIREGNKRDKTGFGLQCSEIVPKTLLLILLGSFLKILVEKHPVDGWAALFGLRKLSSLSHCPASRYWACQRKEAPTWTFRPVNPKDQKKHKGYSHTSPWARISVLLNYIQMSPDNVNYLYLLNNMITTMNPHPFRQKSF